MNFQMFQTRFKGQYPSDIDFSNYIDNKNTQEEQTCQLPCSSITLFIFIGFFFIAMGIAALVANYQQKTVEIQLKQKGLNVYTEPVYVSFGSESTVEVYLKIQQLTQFDYLFDGNKEQGEYFVPNSEICGKYQLNQDLNKSTSINDKKLNPSDYAIPCGLFLAMFPQGEITITLNNNSNIQLDQSNLVYFPYEVQQLNLSLLQKQWVDISDRFFQVWISQNAALTTTKLVGQISGNLSGNFSFDLELKNPLPANYGKASISLSKNQAFGANDIPICIITFVQSGFLFLFSFIVFFYNNLLNADLKKNQMQVHQVELKSQFQAISVKIEGI